MSWPGARGGDLVIQGWRLPPPLPAREGGQDLTTRFLETLLGSRGGGGPPSGGVS